MPDLTYWMAAPMATDGVSIDGYPVQQFTMLATGDDEADFLTMRDHVQAVIGGSIDPDDPGRVVFIGKWRSTSSGEERHEDGKDKFRCHTLLHY